MLQWSERHQSHNCIYVLRCFQHIFNFTTAYPPLPPSAFIPELIIVNYFIRRLRSPKQHASKQFKMNLVAIPKHLHVTFSIKSLNWLTVEQSIFPSRNVEPALHDNYLICLVHDRSQSVRVNNVKSKPSKSLVVFPGWCSGPYSIFNYSIN